MRAQEEHRLQVEDPAQGQVTKNRRQWMAYLNYMAVSVFLTRE